MANKPKCTCHTVKGSVPPHACDRTLDQKVLTDLRKAFVGVLAKHDLVYHFDDGADDCLAEKLKPDTCDVINKVAAGLYSEELFDLACNVIDQENQKS